MRYRQLGATGTQVSVLCLGAMTFGEADEKSMMHKVGSDEKESFAVLDRAFEAGINFNFANAYSSGHRRELNAIGDRSHRPLSDSHARSPHPRKGAGPRARRRGACRQNR